MSVERLQTLLDDPGGDDFWSDFLMAEAEELVEAFSEEQWRQLTTICASWPAARKVRLAQTLTGIKGKPASALESALVFDADERVAHAAADGLRFQDPLPAGDDRMRLIVRLQGLRAGADEFDAHSLDLTLTSLGAAPPRIG